jgi:NDP-mannose synthase
VADMIRVPTRAVILCGGETAGYTPARTILPKPLLPVSDRAIIDIIVEQLKAHGFTDLTLTVGRLASLIQIVMGDGSRHGVSIRYHQEAEPAGTAGALRDLSGLDDTFLFMNGDVLTALDYRALCRAHKAAGNVLTIAAQERNVTADYGILHVDGLAGDTRRVTGYEEKPMTSHTVSMGVYVCEPEVLSYVDSTGRVELPELVLRLVDEGAPVGSFVYDGCWLDCGRQGDYARAEAEFDRFRSHFLPADAG